MDPSAPSESSPLVDHAFEREMTAFIVEALVLKDLEPDAISPTAPLFGAGLGLDSIDALELAVALTRQYQVRLPTDDVETRRVFASVRSLAAYVCAQRGPRQPSDDHAGAGAQGTGSA